MQTTTYQIVDKNDSRKLTEFLCQEGQFLLPMVELITGAEMAETVAVSKSNLSREFIEASEQTLKELSVASTARRSSSCTSTGFSSARPM